VREEQRPHAKPSVVLRHSCRVRNDCVGGMTSAITFSCSDRTYGNYLMSCASHRGALFERIVDHAGRREVTGERAALAQFALDVERAAVSLQHVFHDGETEPEPPVARERPASTR